jgi:PAS domain S-box-containing protein
VSDLERHWRNRISLAFLSFSALLCLVAGYWLANKEAAKDASDASERRFEVQYAALLDMSPSALLIADESGVIRAANKHAEELLGRTALVGRHIHDFCTAETRSGADAGFHRAISNLKQGGMIKLRQVDCLLVNDRGVEIPVQLQIRIIPDEHGAITAASITPLNRISRINMMPKTPTPIEHTSPVQPADVIR